MTLPQILLYPVWIMGIRLLAGEGMVVRTAESRISLLVTLRYVVCNVCHHRRFWIHHELSKAASLFCHLVWGRSGMFFFRK